MAKLSRIVHSVCYFTSYSVVFPTLYVAHSVPGLTPVADGLMDGISTACRSVGTQRAIEIVEESEDALIVEEGLEVMATC
jgi:hypothetical protein